MSVPGLIPQEAAPRYRSKPLRVACVQYDVKRTRVTDNMAKVISLTAGLEPGSVDLLVLPEMALSGYVFKTAADIKPLLEKQETGPTARLVCGLASRLKCHVIAGYPESLDSTDTPESSPEPEKPGDGKLIGYNSAVVAGPDGVIGNCRKTFLFETDEIWAREGSGFKYFDLPEPLGRVAVGICMDLNPKGFTAPWDAFELSTFCVQNHVDILAMPMNWLDPGEDTDTSDEDVSDGEGGVVRRFDPEAPSESNINYWVARLTPLHDPTPVYDLLRGNDADPKAVKEVVFVAANRVGSEDGTRFVGTSAVMTLSAGSIELVEVCNRSEERVLVAEVA